MAEPELILQNINQLDEVNSASSTDVLILTDKASNNATIIDYPDFVSTLLDELQSKNFDLNSGRQTLLNALNSLNTRLNNITAGEGTESVSNAEIIDARTTEATLVTDHLVEASYPTLGEAIRAQINALYDEIKNNNSAENLAQQAKQVADIAKQMAENATNSASIANTKAEEALANSQTAITTANTAETKSEEAKTVASTAGTQSTTALTNSQTALTNSQNALTSAQEAVTTANASNAIASQASVDATDAKEIAEGADDKADQALAQSAQAIESAETATLLSEEARDESQQARVRSTDAEDIARQAREIADGASVVANGANDISEENARVVASMDARINQANSTASQALATSNSANDLAEFTNSRLDSVNDNIQNVNNKIATKVDDMLVEEGLIYLISDGEVVAGPFGPFAGGSGGGGGGGSDSNSAVVRMSNASGWSSKKIAYGSSCPISITWSSLEDDLPTGDGTLTVSVNGVTKITRNVAQGTVTFDVGNYLSVGNNQIKIGVKDVYQNGKTLILTVNTINIQITSTFDSSVPYTGEINFTYTPIGDLRKTVHFILDGVEVGTVPVSVSNRQQSYVISAMTHGVHTFRVYFDAEVEGETLTSNELYYEIIYIEEGNTNTIVASDYSETTVQQYATVLIPYTVYDPISLTAEVVIKVNGNTVSTQTVTRDRQNFSYRADRAGELQISFTSNGTTKAINLTVTATDADIETEEEGLQFELSASGRSNNEEHPDVWTYGTEGEDDYIECSFANFGFVQDGWVMDSEGNTALRTTGDARLSIPFKVFEDDFRATGKTIEIELATRDVLNYDTPIFVCWANNKGIRMTPQSVLFKSESSSVSVSYKEEEHISLAFVVTKRTTTRLICVYINGIMSQVIRYPNDDDFQQASPASIIIGSNEATVDLFGIRVYGHDLTSKQIVDNWISNTQNVDLMLERYNRNNIFNAYGKVVISKLPSYLPYFILVAEELPQYKGDKKTITGSYVDPQHPANSFTFTKCQANVQGTSSATYARKNYDLQFKNGFEMNDGTHADSYALASNVIAFNRFVLKADVASSESTNNTGLTMLFCDTVPYRTPEQEEDPMVRQGIYGFPIVVFWENPTTNQVTLLGKYNFNLPKRAPEPYGFSGDMESWEWQNNTSNRVLFKSADFTETYIDPETGDLKYAWRDDFEARFPSDEWTDTTKLEEWIGWVVTTDRTQATNETLDEPVTYAGVEYTTDSADYRLAKFKAEVGDYVEMDSAIFYYLFTELFLMVDSRAKNMFPSFAGSAVTKAGSAIDRKVIFMPYDMDTGLGTNNEGTLTFGYGLEDTDTVGGADVFNGQQSVFWCNLRDSFPQRIRQMYQNLRSQGKLSYTSVETMYENHQSKWSENIFNEDAQYKYIDPLLEDDNASYLSMLQGSKAEQRKWWLYNRFRYMDSKYNAGDALTDIITLRGYAKADITLTPYADIYPSIKYGSVLVQARGHRNTSYTLACPLDNINDTETYIYSASQLLSIGDISPYKVGYADFTHGTRLTDLKIGDGFEHDAITVSSYPWETNGDDLSFRSTNYQIASSNSYSYWFFKAPTAFTLTVQYQVSSQPSYDKLTIKAGTTTKVNAISGNGSQQTFTVSVGEGEIMEIYATYSKNASTNSNQDRSFISFSGLPEGYQMWKDELPTTYENTNLQELHVGNLPLLKTIDVRNCPNLTQTVDLSQCINLEEAYFSGTSITGLNLANGGALKTLVLPDTVSNLTLRNLTQLSNLKFTNYAGLSTVWLENNHSSIDTYAIFNSVATGSRIRMLGVNWSITSNVTATQNFIDRIKSMRGLDEQGNNMEYPQITGQAYFTIMTGDQYNELHSICPNLEITYGTLQWNVYYYNEDGSTLYQTTKVNNGGNASSYTANKTSTAKYNYTFKGWSIEPYEPFAEAEDYDATQIDSNALKNVTANRNIYAVFQPVIRSYTVTFKNGSTTLQTKTVQYGQDAEYTGSTPTDSTGKVFTGWNPEPTNITGNLTVSAVFVDLEYVKIVQRSWSSGQTLNNSVATKVKPFAMYYAGNGSGVYNIDVSLPNAEYIDFYGLNNINSSIMSFPKIKRIDQLGMYINKSSGENSITSFSMPLLKTINQQGLYGLRNFGTNISFPLLTRLFDDYRGSNGGYFAFWKATGTIDLSKVEIINQTSFGAMFTGVNADIIDLRSLRYWDTQFKFSTSSNVQTVILGSCLASLPDAFFQNASGVVSVEIVTHEDYQNTIVPLSGTTYSAVTGTIVYVPDALLAQYQTATNWSVVYEAGLLKGISEKA